MAESYRVGETVNVTIEDVRVIGEGYDERYDSGYILVALPIGDDEAHGRIHLAAQGVAVERVTPAEWPPRRGDVWRQTGSGLRWFGIVSGSNVYLHSDQGDVLDPQGAYDERAELELDYRVDEPSSDVLAVQVARLREIAGDLHEQAPTNPDPSYCREHCPGCAVNRALGVEGGNPAGQVEAVRDAAADLHEEFFSPAAHGHEQGGGCRDNCPGCRIEAALDDENGADRG